MSDDQKIPAAVLKPSLEYLHQYPVTKVTAKKDGSGWAIEFENGAVVESLDPTIPVPEFADGVSLLTTMYDSEKTVLRFGRVVKVRGGFDVQDEIFVTLNPIEYAITDPRFDETAFPQRVEDDDAGTSAASEE